MKIESLNQYEMNSSLREETKQHSVEPHIRKEVEVIFQRWMRTI